MVCMINTCAIKSSPLHIGRRSLSHSQPPPAPHCRASRPATSLSQPDIARVQDPMPPPPPPTKTKGYIRVVPLAKTYNARGSVLCICQDSQLGDPNLNQRAEPAMYARGDVRGMKKKLATTSELAVG